MSTKKAPPPQVKKKKSELEAPIKGNLPGQTDSPLSIQRNRIKLPNWTNKQPEPKIPPQTEKPGRIEVSPQLSGLISKIGKKLENKSDEQDPKTKITDNNREDVKMPNSAEPTGEIPSQSIGDQPEYEKTASDKKLAGILANMKPKNPDADSSPAKKKGLGSMVSQVRQSIDIDEKKLPTPPGTPQKTLDKVKLAGKVVNAWGADTPQATDKSKTNPEKQTETTDIDQKNKRKGLVGMMEKYRSMSEEGNDETHNTPLSKSGFGGIVDKIRSESLEGSEEKEKDLPKDNSGEEEKLTSKERLVSVVAKVKPTNTNSTSGHPPRLAQMVDQVRSSLDNENNEGTFHNEEHDIKQSEDELVENDKKQEKSSDESESVKNDTKVQKKTKKAALLAMFGKEKKDDNKDKTSKGNPRLTDTEAELKSSLDVGKQDNPDKKENNETSSKATKESRDESEGYVEEKVKTSKMSALIGKIRKKSTDDLTKTPKLYDMIDKVRDSIDKDTEENVTSETSEEMHDKSEEVKKTDEKERKGKVASLFNKIRRKSQDDELNDIKQTPKLANMVDALRESIDKDDRELQIKNNKEALEQEKEESGGEKKKNKEEKIANLISKIRRKSSEIIEGNLTKTPKLAAMVDEIRSSIDKGKDEDADNDAKNDEVDERVDGDKSHTKNSPRSKATLAGLMISKIRSKSKESLDVGEKPSKPPKLAEMVVKIKSSIDRTDEKLIAENDTDDVKATALKCNTLPHKAAAATTAESKVDEGGSSEMERHHSQPNLLTIEKESGAGTSTGSDSVSINTAYQSSTLPRMLEKSKKATPTNHHTLPRAKRVGDMPPLVKPKMGMISEDTIDEDDPDPRMPAPNPCCQRLPYSEELLFGSAQVTIGVLILVLGIVAIITGTTYALFAYRIIGGCIFVVAGGLGIGTRIQYKNKALLNTCMSISLLSVVIAGSCIAVDYFAYLEDNKRSDKMEECVGLNVETGKVCRQLPLWKQRKWHLTTHIVSMVMFGVEVLLGFVQSGFCFRRACCLSRDKEMFNYSMDVTGEHQPVTDNDTKSQNDTEKQLPDYNQNGTIQPAVINHLNETKE